MPFDYLHSKIPRNFADAGEKAEAQYLKEIRERASLLYRLGYSKETTLKRMQGNLYWDWECNPRPGYVANLKKALPLIVDEVFSKPKPPEKGRRVTFENLRTKSTD